MKILDNKKAKIIFTVISIIFSVLFSYMIIELLNKNALFMIYTKRLLFNFTFIILIHLFIYSLTNKLNLTIILSNTLLFILGIINYVVLCFRGTPFVPWDVLSVKTAIHVASAYTFSINYQFIIATLLFILIFFIGLKTKYELKNKKANIIIRILGLLIVFVAVFAFYTTDIIDYFDFENNLWNPKDEYKNNGFLASFVKQSKNLINEKPQAYSKGKVEELLPSTTPKEDNQDKPNIIVIMNESYSDLSVNGEIKVSQDYMKFFYSLKDNTIRGNTYVSVIGGQTPNSEWEFLTNNSMAFMPYRTVPYQQYIRHRCYSLANTLKDQGYVANAIHPWYGAGYRRNAVYPLMGFDSFESIETLDGLDYLRTYPTDLSIYDYVINQFEEKQNDEKVFDFVVTMQNHSGYDIPGMKSTVFLENMEHFPRVEQYLTLIKKSDEALEHLINYFKNYEEKTIILFFGDHQPPYFEDEFWETILENPDDERTKYITPFILWANYDIEEKEVDKISLNYLSILLMDTAQLKTTPYMEFLRNVQEELPVITGNGYIDNNGNYYTLYSENEYSKILKDYEIIQYNNIFDYKNTVDRFFKITQ